MRTVIVFPNSLCLPNQVYFSLPVLAGALRDAGHERHFVDHNAQAAALFLDDERAERYLGAARDRATAFRRNGSRTEAHDLERMLAEYEEKVRAGQRCKEILRDPERFLDQPLFKWAFWNVVDVLAFYYQLDPIISPHRPTFARDMIRFQEEDPWSPARDLYDEGLLDLTLATRPDLVAISIAFPEQAAESLRLARLIRQRRPEAHICFGGPLISLYPDRWLEDGWLLRYGDSVCVGDGERTIVELADALEGRGSLDDVRNLVWRDARGELRRPTEPPFLEDMETVPVPDFDAGDLDVYLTPEPIYPVMASRGCYWGRCKFCSIGWRENYRQASREKIRTDLRDVARRGARYIQLQDSSVPPTAAARVSRIIEEEGLELRWGGGMKFESCFLQREYCEQLARGGCVSIMLGFESSEQRLLDLMDKGYEVTDCPAMLENLRDAGISAQLLWFVGFPSEERWEALRTARYLYEHRHLFGLTAFVGNYELYPDSEIFEHPEKYGVLITGRDNDRCLFEVERGMPPEEASFLEKLLACNNNRTLTCNGSQIIHLAETGPDLSGLERPMEVPDEVIEFCTTDR